MLAIMQLSTGLIVPTPASAQAFMHAPSPRVASSILQPPSSSDVFPSELLAAETRQFTEDEMNAARTKGLAVLAFGVLPSFWAQNELVWNKKEKETNKKKASKKRR